MFFFHVPFTEVDTFREGRKTLDLANEWRIMAAGWMDFRLGGRGEGYWTDGLDSKRAAYKRGVGEAYEL